MSSGARTVTVLINGETLFHGEYSDLELMTSLSGEMMLYAKCDPDRDRDLIPFGRSILKAVKP